MLSVYWNIILACSTVDGCVICQAADKDMQCLKCDNHFYLNNGECEGKTWLVFC